MNKLVRKWEFTTDEVTKSFLIKYFELEDGELYKNDYFWVGNEVGGICNFGDYYINFSDMAFCLKNDVPVTKFFEWYDWCLESQVSINLDSFIMGASKVKELEEEQIKTLRLKVEQAEQILKEALEKYNSNNKK